MRIATSTIYQQQSDIITTQNAKQVQLGQDISSGISLNAPSDDPTQIAQDLSLRTTIGVTNTSNVNVANAISELTTVDATLAQVTNALQSARQYTIEGASDALSPQQRNDIANQVDALIGQLVSAGNAQYAGKYLFTGTAVLASAPFIAAGNPPTQVTFNGNLETKSEQLANGQNVPITVTAQQAFNVNATDKTPDVFQTLITLRDTLRNGYTTDQSAHALNEANRVINPATPLGQEPLATTLKPDSNGFVAFSIDGPQGSVKLSFNPNNDSINTVVAQINANTATTGVSAQWNNGQQRLVLNGLDTHNVPAPFTITDVPSGPGGVPSSPGPTQATNAANFTTSFALQTTANITQNLSRQIGDVDRVLNQALNARAIVGSRLQALSTIKNQFSQSVTDNTSVQSRIEDTDVAKSVSAFSLAQTALQAAYATTTKLEGKTLFDYIG